MQHLTSTLSASSAHLARTPPPPPPHLPPTSPPPPPASPSPPPPRHCGAVSQESGQGSMKDASRNCLLYKARQSKSADKSVCFPTGPGSCLSNWPLVNKGPAFSKKDGVFQNPTFGASMIVGKWVCSSDLSKKAGAFLVSVRLDPAHTSPHPGYFISRTETGPP